MSGSESYGQPEKGYADVAPVRASWGRRAARASRSHWVLSTLAVVLVVVLGGAMYVYSRVKPLLSVADVAVSYTVPDAPHLVAGNRETVYRIDPTHSSLTYGVDENIVGQTAHHATGSTNGIAGDLALNTVDPSASRVGTIVANVEQLHSDNNLRDAQIRQRYLDSAANPLVSFTTTKLSGLPSAIVDGHTYTFTMSGDLKVKSVSAPESWKVTAKVSAGGEVDATATTTVKMSTFGVGPINLAGLVSTGDDVALTFKLTALDPSKYAIPTTIAPPPGVAHTGTGPSFKSAVAADPRAELRVVPRPRPGRCGPLGAQDGGGRREGRRRPPGGHRSQVHAAVAGVEPQCADAALEGHEPVRHRHRRGVGRGRRQARRAGDDPDHAGQAQARHPAPARTS